MKYLEEFQYTGESFEDRDSPSALLSALGRAALDLAELRQRVEVRICKLSENLGHRPPDDLGQMSLDAALDLLGKLMAIARERERFNVGDDDPQDFADELIQVLRQAAEHYRRIVKPDLLTLHLRNTVPAHLPGWIMDVADYVAYAHLELDQYFLAVDPIN